MEDEDPFLGLGFLVALLVKNPPSGGSDSKESATQRLEGRRRWKPGEAVTFQKDLCLSGAGQRGHCPSSRRDKLSS